ncbi:MAG: glutathione S-transferase [Halieaceae bacterium]|jgi:glutathione S-transferase
MIYPRFKLYHFSASRSARVRWLLHELLHEDFEIEVVPLYEGAQYSSEYLQKNPNHSVPLLEITLENGETHSMLESGAMVSLLADCFPDKGLAPKPAPFSLERADYLQMLHFGTSTMDMMLWQIRFHTHLLGEESDEKTIARYREKFTQEVEPQLLARLGYQDYICGDNFCAVDCVMGQNIMWATAYGLCKDPHFAEYLGRVSTRPAFALAYSDLQGFSLAPG